MTPPLTWQVICFSDLLLLQLRFLFAAYIEIITPFLLQFIHIDFIMLEDTGIFQYDPIYPCLII